MVQATETTTVNPADLLAVIKANYLAEVRKPSNMLKLVGRRVGRVAECDTYRMTMWVRNAATGPGIGPSNYVHVDDQGRIVKMET